MVKSAMFKLAHLWHIGASGNKVSYAVASYAPHKQLPKHAGRPRKASHMRPGALRMAGMHTYMDGSQPGILVWLLTPCQSKDTETFDLGGQEPLFELLKLSILVMCCASSAAG